MHGGCAARPKILPRLELGSSPGRGELLREQELEPECCASSLGLLQGAILGGENTFVGPALHALVQKLSKRVCSLLPEKLALLSSRISTCKEGSNTGGAAWLDVIWLIQNFFLDCIFLTYALFFRG